MVTISTILMLFKIENYPILYLRSPDKCAIMESYLGKDIKETAYIECNKFAFTYIGIPTYVDKSSLKAKSPI